jgi:hypothetical protein
VSPITSLFTKFTIALPRFPGPSLYSTFSSSVWSVEASGVLQHQEWSGLLDLQAFDLLDVRHDVHPELSLQINLPRDISDHYL